MSRSRIAVLTAATALFASGALAAGAGAVYHEYRISEVHQGTATATGDYVELQAFSANQNLVGGHYVITYDGGNSAMSTFQFPSMVANAASQATILVANDASVTGADFIAPAGTERRQHQWCGLLRRHHRAAGRRRLRRLGPRDGRDPPSPAGTPIPTGLGDNQSFSRSLARGCATALDTADDTNNSSVDFALVTPSPRPNSVAPTETLCAPKGTGGGKKKKCKKKKKEEERRLGVRGQEEEVQEEEKEEVSRPA